MHLFAFLPAAENCWSFQVWGFFCILLSNRLSKNKDNKKPKQEQPEENLKQSKQTTPWKLNQNQT